MSDKGFGLKILNSYLQMLERYFVFGCYQNYLNNSKISKLALKSKPSAQFLKSRLWRHRKIIFFSKNLLQPRAQK